MTDTDKPPLTCVLCGQHLRDGEKVTCRRCVTRLARALNDIVTLYALLDDVIEPGSVMTDGNKPKGRRADAPVPVRLDVLALRDPRTTWTGVNGEIPSVLGVLASWAQVVREDRGLASPCRACQHNDHDTPCGALAMEGRSVIQCRCNRYVPPLATVTSETSLLRKHLDWVAQQPWVDEMAGEIHKLHSALRTICGEPKTRKVGTCVNDDGRGPCRGPLMPSRFSPAVTCARCGDEWDEADLRRLGLILGEEETA